ncbi:MAG TPA: amino acid adenylation domain-containing protein [Puia sp.]|jgi:amino acid adenylation domain-containing protein|nr:amino acid adenylation domain-containing protein [Puia sp.]
MNSYLEVNFANVFADQARLRPAAPAIEDGENSLTYGELELATNRLAAVLVEMGFVKGQRAILFAGKNVASVVVIFGIVKAGGVYVPVDKEIPSGRLQLILGETAPAVFFEPYGVNATVPELPSGCMLVSRDVVAECIREGKAAGGADAVGDAAGDAVGKAGGDAVGNVVIEPDDLCYIMYTSGSTGRPKGVPISHGNFGAFMDSIDSVFIMSEQSRCMNTLPFYFDGCIVDTFFPLYKGASLYISPALPMPGLLVNILVQKKITHFTATPSVLTLLYQYLDARGITLNNLEMIMSGAEVCDKKVIHFFLGINPGMKVINGYGPTEATCDAVTYTISEPSDNMSGYFPIGYPLKHVKAFLQTAAGELTDEAGSKGELLLAGPQVFKGYLQRPEESARALEEINGEVYYHTGDLCCINADGVIDFLGRVDEEFKLNGYRIHPNEVRQALLRMPGVKATEIVVATAGNERLLCAAVILSREGDGESLKALPHQLGSLLPSYMIPRIFAEYRELPMSPTMKTDRKKLQAEIEVKLTETNKSFFSMIEDTIGADK